MSLATAILEAVAAGCSVEIWNNRGVVMTDVRKRVGDKMMTCSRGVGAYELKHAAGPDFVLSEAVRLATRQILEDAP